MRITLQIEDGVLRAAEERAARSGYTLSAFVEDALRRALAEAKRRPGHAPQALPTFRGDGLLPGVDLDSSAATLDLWTTGNSHRQLPRRYSASPDTTSAFGRRSSAEGATDSFVERPPPPTITSSRSMTRSSM